MTLEQCTKAELIQIIKKLPLLDEYCIKDALFEIEIQRTEKRLNKAEEYGEIASENLYKYIEILKPYENKPLSDIPSDVLNQAAKYEKAYKNARKKEFELIRKERKQ